MRTYYTASNIRKGNLLELPIQEVFKSIGFKVKEHFANREGLDIECSVSNIKLIGEAINWRNGYIHPERFNDIIGKLSALSELKFFFCCGVKPTKAQSNILRAMGVNIIHLPKQILSKTENSVLLLKYKILAVITSLFNIDTSSPVKSFRPSRRIVNVSILVKSIDKVISRLKNRLLIAEKKLQNHDFIDVTVSNNE